MDLGLGLLVRLLSRSRRPALASLFVLRAKVEIQLADIEANPANTFVCVSPQILDPLLDL